MKVRVSGVAGDGIIRRAVLDAAAHDDAARWEGLTEQAGLGVPPPYRPRVGEAVYHIRAGELAVQVAERDLTGRCGSWSRPCAPKTGMASCQA